MKNYKYKNKDWLYNEYIIKNRSTTDIGKECGVRGSSVNRYVKIFGFKKDKESRYRGAQEKAKKTNLERYGVDNPLKSKEIQNKVDQTNLERYGQKRQFQRKEIQDKIKEVNLEKYGVEKPFQSKEIQEKAKNSLIEKYNSHSYLETQECKEKTKETMLRKFGKNHYTQTDEFREKAKKTNLERYGVEKPIYSEEIKQKIKKTTSSEEYQNKRRRHFQKKYGANNPFKSKEVRGKIYQTKKKNNSFNKSSHEEGQYELYKQYFPNIQRQYKDSRYPFSCDFYIPEYDLFIEHQGNWTHGNKPYVGQNMDEWIEKSKNSKFYQNALQVYTVDDPKKRRCAKENNLNFLETWTSNPEYNLKQIFRQINGLSYSYSEEICKKEFNKIYIESGDINSTPNINRIVLSYQPHFYEKENELWKDSITQRKLILNRVKYLNKKEQELTDRELLRGFKISGFHYGFSHFSPLWIKYFIEKYNIKSLYDPCAGWGHRLLGTAGTNCHYIGNDIDPRTVKGLQKIGLDYQLNNTVYNKDCTIFTPKENYEAVFTCPPYFTDEKYKFFREFESLGNWVKKFWTPLVFSSIKGGVKYFAFVISDKYKDLMKEAFMQFQLIEEVRVGSKIGTSHFGKKETTRSEFLVVYRVL